MTNVSPVVLAAAKSNFYSDVKLEREIFTEDECFLHLDWDQLDAENMAGYIEEAENIGERK
jgi:hypothetical protein